MFKRSMYAWINGFWFISNVVLLKTAAVVLSGIAKPRAHPGTGLGINSFGPGIKTNTNHVINKR